MQILRIDEMKYAIMSDIHGNTAAFKAALADAKKRGCGKIVCLGDLTGHGDDSVGCINLAMKETDVCLMGNHDSACCVKEDPFVVAMFSNYNIDVATRELLSEAQMEWLRARQYVWEGPGFACTHSEFSNPRAWGCIFGPEDARMSLLSREEPILFVGHTHMPALMEQSAANAKLAKSFDEKEVIKGMMGLKELKAKACAVQPGARYVVNVGSVGRPRQGSTHSYATYDAAAKMLALVTFAVVGQGSASEDKVGISRNSTTFTPPLGADPHDPPETMARLKKRMKRFLAKFGIRRGRFKRRYAQELEMLESI